MTNGVMNGAKNRKLLILFGPWPASRCSSWSCGSRRSCQPQRIQGRIPGACRDGRCDTARGGTGRREGGRGDQGPAKPYAEAEYRDLSGRREPRRHLGGRAAPPAVRGVRPCRPNLRVHHRGDRLQDRRPAIRPARARVHEAALRLLLAHRDLRRVPDVHAHRAVSEVHELPDERVLPDLSPVRAALLLRGLLPLHLLLRLGEVPSPGASRSGARPQPRGHGASC